MVSLGLEFYQLKQTNHYVDSKKIIHSIIKIDNWRDSVVVRASALQSVDLGFIFQVESCQKILKSGIHSFHAWRSAK